MKNLMVLGFLALLTTSVPAQAEDNYPGWHPGKLDTRIDPNVRYDEYPNNQFSLDPTAPTNTLDERAQELNEFE